MRLQGMNFVSKSQTLGGRKIDSDFSLGAG